MLTCGRDLNTAMAGWRLTLSLFLVATATNLPQPLYPRYVAGLASPHLATSVAFATYVAGLVPCLLLARSVQRFAVGGLLIVSLALSCLATIGLMMRPGFPALLAFRLLSGSAMGIAVPSASAALSWVHASAANGTARAASAVALATGAGFGSGALAAG